MWGPLTSAYLTVANVTTDWAAHSGDVGMWAYVSCGYGIGEAEQGPEGSLSR